MEGLEYYLSVFGSSELGHLKINSLNSLLFLCLEAINTLFSNKILLNLLPLKIEVSSD